MSGSAARLLPRVSRLAAFAVAVCFVRPPPAAADPPDLSPPDDQPAAAATTIERLQNLDATEQLLHGDDVASDEEGHLLVKATYERGVHPKVRFRVTLSTPDGGTIEGLLKVKQQNYRDWVGELFSYRLGRALGIRLTPTVDRCFPRSVLDIGLADQPAEVAELVTWEGEGDETHACGSFTYWVPEFQFKIGPLASLPETFDTLTGWMGPNNRDWVAGSQPLRDLTAVFLLDFLVFNEDRPHNVGSVRFPDTDVQLLVAIDFGDSLYSPSRRDVQCRRWLWRIKVFPETLVDSLRNLDADALRSLLSAEVFGATLDDDIVDAVLDRREQALARIDELVAAHPDDTLY
ncbi:MAG: hypothetical protein HY905_04245 [Deltaproteobacteria bacterium]|nr:hypothetical protein [Deltaproteobacteria bacterium]